MLCKTIHVVAGILVQDGLYFVAKRNPGGPAGDKWEFPGGKVESGEESRMALIRELREELDLVVHVGDELGMFETVVGTTLIALQCYFVHVVAGEVKLSSHSDHVWVPKGELLGIDFASPDLPVVQAILQNVE